MVDGCVVSICIVIVLIIIIIIVIVCCKENLSNFSNSGKGTFGSFFWHIGALNDNVEKILDRQYKRIKESGLIEGGVEIKVCIINKLKEDTKTLKKIKNEFNVIYEIEDGYECSTMYEIWKYSKKNPNKFIGYIHSKGVTRETNKNVEDWTNYLEYYTIDKWKENIKYLKEGYDSVGCNLKKEDTTHYSGNFWWARSNYIGRNENPINFSYSDDKRKCSEHWLLKNSGKFKELKNSGINHYNEPYGEDNYII